MALNPLATDNFNRADGGLGANWTTQSGFVAPLIVSNSVDPNAVGGSGSAAYYNAVAFPNDQYSQIVAGALTNSNDGILACVRCDSGSSSFYALQVKGPTGASAVAQLKKVVAGVTTVIVANTTITLATSDVFRLEVIGTTLTGYQNNVAIPTLSTTDVSLSAGYAGISIFAAAGSTTDAGLDNWEGGGFGTNPPKKRPRRIITTTYYG